MRCHYPTKSVRGIAMLPQAELRTILVSTIGMHLSVLSLWREFYASRKALEIFLACARFLLEVPH